MTMTGEHTYAIGPLTIERSSDGGRRVLAWSGECDFRDPAVSLDPVLQAVLTDAAKESASEAELVFDFRALAFMNSSSVTPVLRCIKMACGEGIPVRLIYNSDISWQRTVASSMRSLRHALKSLSVDQQSL